MPGIDDIGIENSTQGICGFTSTLYAVYESQPRLKKRLEDAVDVKTRSTRLMAEIKTFLQMMKANGNRAVLDQITELTTSFPTYSTWSVDWYIEKINKLEVFKYSIAMPPEATMEYMRTVWNMNPILTSADDVRAVPVILGLTRSNAPINRWNNLAHYVYQSITGRIYSWGEQFNNLEDVNDQRRMDYSVVYRIYLF